MTDGYSETSVSFRRLRTSRRIHAGPVWAKYGRVQFQALTAPLVPPLPIAFDGERVGVRGSHVLSRNLGDVPRDEGKQRGKNTSQVFVNRAVIGTKNAKTLCMQIV